MRDYDKEVKEIESNTNYNRDLDVAKKARVNQRLDTSPMIEKEGFLGMDDIDRLRRRKIRPQ